MYAFHEVLTDPNPNTTYHCALALLSSTAIAPERNKSRHTQRRNVGVLNRLTVQSVANIAISRMKAVSSVLDCICVLRNPVKNWLSVAQRNASHHPSAICTLYIPSKPSFRCHIFDSMHNIFPTWSIVCRLFCGTLRKPLHFFACAKRGATHAKPDLQIFEKPIRVPVNFLTAWLSIF